MQNGDTDDAAMRTSLLTDQDNEYVTFYFNFKEYSVMNKLIHENGLGADQDFLENFEKLK